MKAGKEGKTALGGMQAEVLEAQNGSPGLAMWGHRRAGLQEGTALLHSQCNGETGQAQRDVRPVSTTWALGHLQGYPEMVRRGKPLTGNLRSEYSWEILAPVLES